MPPKIDDGLDLLGYVKSQLANGFGIQGFQTIQARKVQAEAMWHAELAAKARADLDAEAEADSRAKAVTKKAEAERAKAIAEALAAKQAAEAAMEVISAIVYIVLGIVGFALAIIWAIFPFVFVRKINILIAAVERLNK